MKTLIKTHINKSGQTVNILPLPKEVFTSVVKGKNFMTPNVTGYYDIKDGAAEISYGKGIFTDTIYGVTVVRNGAHDCDLSKMCDTLSETFDYVESLIK